MGDRCTGHCCRAFHIDTRGLAAEYEAAKAALEKGLSLTIAQKDAVFWAENLIVLPAKKSTNHNSYEPVNQLPFETEVEHPVAYTCAKLRPNGDCGDYENRPWTCSSYPNGYACTFVYCTSKEARNGATARRQGHRLNQLVSAENLVFGLTRSLRRAAPDGPLQRLQVLKEKKKVT